jgi:hypothetical protein
LIKKEKNQFLGWVALHDQCVALALPPKETSHVQNFMLLMAAVGEGNCMDI